MNSSQLLAAVAQVQMDLVSERIERLREKVHENANEVDDTASIHSDGDQSQANGDAVRLPSHPTNVVRCSHYFRNGVSEGMTFQG